jgi:hypothetical protein
MEKDEKGRPLAPKFQLYHFTKKANLPKDFYKKARGNR